MQTTISMNCKPELQAKILNAVMDVLKENTKYGQLTDEKFMGGNWMIESVKVDDRGELEVVRNDGINRDVRNAVMNLDVKVES